MGMFARVALLASAAVAALGVSHEEMLEWQEAAKHEVAAEAARQIAALRAVRGFIELSDAAFEQLVEVYSASYQFSIQKTLRVFPEDNSTFITTGDIGQMWLRDSTSQLNSYMSLVTRLSKDRPDSSALQAVFESAMQRQVLFINDDVYSSAFFDTHGAEAGPTKKQCPMAPDCPTCTCSAVQCAPRCGKYTYQRNFELDSLLNVLLLHTEYWRRSGIVRHVDNAPFRRALEQIASVCEVEQHHTAKSPYRFPEKQVPVVKDGVGLVWSYARPSDDVASGGYNIPDNMMVVAVFTKLLPMLKHIGVDEALVRRFRNLAEQAEAGIEEHGVTTDPITHEKIYAFEVDGFGAKTAADDANMPNLLWIPYLGYGDHLQLYNNTRAFSLSRGDGNYFKGKIATGLGSAHQSHGLRSHHGGPQCYKKCVWHLGLVMDGYTTPDRAHKLKVLKEILASLDGQALLHEGFNADNASEYNRDWFGWADAMFSNWVRADWIEYYTK